MRIPFRKTDAEKRSADAQAALTSARAKLNELDVGRAVAQTDAAAFAQWSIERSVAALEVDRLAGLVEAIETDASDMARAAAASDAKRQLDAARKQSADLADRIKIDGQRIVTELLVLARECARQSLVAKTLNANLPEGEQPIPAADILARDFGVEPRRDLRTRELSLWVAENSGEIVGDQRAVVSEDGIRGQVNILGGTVRRRCVKRRFTETEYHPSTAPDWPGDLFQLIRLPRLDGPGSLFDGAYMVAEMVADLDVDAISSPRKRQPRPAQVELVPIDPWPPAGTTGEAAKNEAL
jgi:hypothetical protein